MKAWLLKLLVEMSKEENNLPLPPLSPSKTIPCLAPRILSANPKAIYIKLLKWDYKLSWIEEKLLC